MISSPSKRPRPDELEALIKEARARQLRRRLGAAVVIALLAAAALGIDSVIGGANPIRSTASGPATGAKTGSKCGIRVDNRRILGPGGGTRFREPGHWTRSYPHPSVVRCLGSSIWVVWDNGAAMNQEGYVGAHSGDGGRSWRLVFAEPFFGVKAPHDLGSHLGPWTLGGSNVAYFSAWCPVCGYKAPFGTDFLWVTKDGGRSFREYKLPALMGYQPIGIRVSGRDLAIRAKEFSRGTWRQKTVTVHVG